MQKAGPSELKVAREQSDMSLKTVWELALTEIKMCGNWALLCSMQVWEWGSSEPEPDLQTVQ